METSFWARLNRRLSLILPEPGSPRTRQTHRTASPQLRALPRHGLRFLLIWEKWMHSQCNLDVENLPERPLQPSGIEVATVGCSPRSPACPETPLLLTQIQWSISVAAGLVSLAGASEVSLASLPIRLMVSELPCSLRSDHAPHWLLRPRHGRTELFKLSVNKEDRQPTIELYPTINTNRSLLPLEIRRHRTWGGLGLSQSLVSL